MKKAYKILMLTPQLPYPAHQGTSLRNLHLLKGVARRHQVTLLSFTERGGDIPQPLLELTTQVVTVPVPTRTTGKRLQQMMTSRWPDMAQRLYSDEFRAKLHLLLQENDFDIVQVEGIELARYMADIQVAAPEAALVFDDHNAEAALQARVLATDKRMPKRWLAAAYSWVQVRRLRRFERWACATAALVTVVSEADADEIAALTGKRPQVIPNCIDVASYRPRATGEKIKTDVVLVGKMDYRPNVDAALWWADAIWPLIRAALPDATCAIVGQKPHARLDRLRQVAGLTITGGVPKVQPYLHGAKVMVMPFRMGSGTRLKLIESMAAGRAIVSTRLGAEGFPLTDGRQLRLADEAGAFAEAVVALLMDSAERDRLGQAAQTFAQRYDWRVVTAALEPLFKTIAS